MTPTMRPLPACAQRWIGYSANSVTLGLPSLASGVCEGGPGGEEGQERAEKRGSGEWPDLQNIALD